MRSLSHPDKTWESRRWWVLFPGALVLGGVTTILARQPLAFAALAGVAVYAGLAFASFRKPLVFVLVFLASLVVLPPFYFARLGSTPVYIPVLLAPMGWAVLLSRLAAFRVRTDDVGRGLMIFLWSLALSIPFAFYFSGVTIGAESVLRWFLLAQTVLVYFLIRSEAGRAETFLQRWLIPALLVAGVAAALYGVVDFYWPVPLPHPAADQYIWVRSGVLRRAQGVLYEASSFGNLCGFFLVVVSGGFFAREEGLLGFRRPWLLSAVGIFTLAIFLAFSRSVWASVLVAISIFVLLYRRVRISRILGFFLVTGACFGLILVYSAELWNYFLSARVGNLTLLLADPNLASSGRLDTWFRVLSLLQSHPQYLLFGVGYKTLPFTRLFHKEIITDNGFLNLLLETGVLGLAGFLVFSAAVFRKFLGLARQSDGVPRFWSALMFSFWCGEWVQMLAVDAYTFWRNMIVFVALMAIGLNLAEGREGSRTDGSPMTEPPRIGTP